MARCLARAWNIVFNIQLFRLFRVLTAGKFICSVCGEEKYFLKANNMPNSFEPTIGGAPGRVCMDCVLTLKKICPKCEEGCTPLGENGVSNFAIGDDEGSRICL